PKGEVLSNDFLVCLKIYEFNSIRNEDIWFSKLVKEMRGNPTQSTISKCIDRLFDRGIINADWKMVDGHWTRTLQVAAECEGFVESLYRITEECDD
ncbi:MAG: hypothetical protein ACI38Y_06800, partial [Candidatus Methanomethylophilaceae archaeon]